MGKRAEIGNVRMKTRNLSKNYVHRNESGSMFGSNLAKRSLKSLLIRKAVSFSEQTARENCGLGPIKSFKPGKVM